MTKTVAGIIAALIVTVLGAVLAFYLVGDEGLLTEEKVPVLGGDIKSVELANTSPCCTFTVQAEIEGMKDQSCSLYATIVDAQTGSTGSPIQLGTFQPEADKDRASFNFEVPITRAGDFYVHFSLVDPDGVELDSQDTSPIAVR
jgi:hypothetical protein